MCQFHSRSDPGYVTVKSRIEEIRRETPHLVVPHSGSKSALPPSKLERRVRAVQREFVAHGRNDLPALAHIDGTHAEILSHQAGVQLLNDDESTRELLALKRSTPKLSSDDNATAIPPSLFWGYAQTRLCTHNHCTATSKNTLTVGLQSSFVA
jgi:hypothetical protein